MANPIRDNGTRQDTFVIRVHLNGAPLGIWDKKTGGGIDSDSVSYFPGNMGKKQNLGGRSTPGNVTLQRNYDRDDDHPKINTLYKAAGKGKVTISQQPLDLDGHTYGKAIIFTGKLKRVQEPDVDSEATSAALLEIEVEIDGKPSAQ